MERRHIAVCNTGCIMCEHGDVRALELLMENNAKVNIQDNAGATPLHYACVRVQVFGLKLMHSSC